MGRLAHAAHTDFDLYAFDQPTLSESAFVNGSFNDQLNEHRGSSGGGVLPSRTTSWSRATSTSLIDAYSPVPAPIDLYFVGA